MEYLTRKDELMILSILKLEKEASLVKLRESLNSNTSKKWSIGNVFVSLERLENLGYIHTKLGEPTGKRGGKAVKNYIVSNAGMEALKETKKMQDGMWEGLHDIVFGK
jgi:PadR family transcriptional regulator, regulatory protein PadR